MSTRLGVALAMLVAACTPAASPAPAVPTWDRPGLQGAVRPEMGSPQPGEPAPDFDLPDTGGQSVRLSSMRGSWVLLHFTATWCPFCDSEVRHLGELADAFRSRGVRTLIVDVEEEAATWQAYAKARVGGAVIPLHDASGAAAARFAPPRAQPSFEDRAQAVLDSTLILDPEGKIRLFLLPDSAHFDPTFRGVRAELERLVPAPVVTVEARSAPFSLSAASGQGEIAVTLRVADGYHVMSDRPSAPTYIPTRVSVDRAPGLELGDVRYPAPSSFVVGDRAIATFQGTVDVKIPVTLTNEAALGSRRLHGAVRFQACTESRCLFPTTRNFDVTVSVVP
jgi:peroxiredoxin